MNFISQWLAFWHGNIRLMFPLDNDDSVIRPGRRLRTFTGLWEGPVRKLWRCCTSQGMGFIVSLSDGVIFEKSISWIEIHSSDHHFTEVTFFQSRAAQQYLLILVSTDQSCSSVGQKTAHIHGKSSSRYCLCAGQCCNFDNVIIFDGYWKCRR